MALIHEKLYQSESLAKIDLAEYVQSLTSYLFLSYGVSERVIKPKISIENVTLNIDRMIPCALIINELVSNSLKHAFPDSWRRAGGTGEIRIDLRQDTGHKCQLTVSDNGVGLPRGLKMKNCESLGLKLVSVLVKQLKGVIQINQRRGSEFVVTFDA
ncbi:MAG: hypothetical protein HY787_06660 [Deltaproteobacteria bacterium]|nr:hypothetical protein [Deltaproteobacteria bacterium]